VAALVTDIVRAFVFLWLLLTVPVVCHHETAVALLGALDTGHSQHHAMSAQVAAHNHHAAVPAADEASGPDAVPALPSSPPPSTTSEWCAGHTTGVAAGLPGGLDGLAFFGHLDLPAPTLGPAVAHEFITTTSAIRTPPAPPPRLLV